MNATPNHILVSIITIVYNGGELIERTIRSVADQTYPNIQYIIIDGGSTDNTMDIVSKFDNVVSFSCSEKDHGISDAFNKGIAKAKGELIGLINCGDYYSENAVADMVHTFSRHMKAENEYLVFHGKIRMFNAFFDKIYSPPSITTFPYQMPIWHPTVFVNRQVYKDFKYNEKYKIAMDYELFSRVYEAKGRFIFVDKLLTSMNTVGVSNNQASLGFKEVMIASRENLHVGVVKSYFYYMMRISLNRFIGLLKKNA